MRTRYALTLAMIAGFGLGAVAVQGLHAQAKPRAYVVLEIDLTNPDGFNKEYLPALGTTITDQGGKYLARGGKIVAIEGPLPKRLTVIEFENMDKAQATFASAKY